LAFCTRGETVTPGCDRCFRRKAEWKKHVERGRGDPTLHRTGFVRGYAAGAIVGADSAADALRRAIATQAEGVTVHGGEGGSAVPTLCTIDELQCKLCDGTQWAPPPPPSGFAGSSQSRVPTRSRSALQLRFCIIAGHLIGEAGYEGMRGQEASQLMLEWGTPAFGKRYPKVPEAAASLSGLPMLPRTAQLSPSELTPLLMTAKPKLEARLLKEAQHELRLPAKTRSKA
jgi:hypothetical protein